MLPSYVYTQTPPLNQVKKTEISEERPQPEGEFSHLCLCDLNHYLCENFDRKCNEISIEVQE